MTGLLTAPLEFATFNYADYLARQGVYALTDRPQVKVLAHDQGSPILSIIYGFRNRAYVVIQQILPEPQASLLSGILLGVDAWRVREAIKQDISLTSTPADSGSCKLHPGLCQTLRSRSTHNSIQDKRRAAKKAE